MGSVPSAPASYGPSPTAKAPATEALNALVKKTGVEAAQLLALNSEELVAVVAKNGITVEAIRQRAKDVGVNYTWLDRAVDGDILAAILKLAREEASAGRPEPGPQLELEQDATAGDGPERLRDMEAELAAKDAEIRDMQAQFEVRVKDFESELSQIEAVVHEATEGLKYVDRKALNEIPRLYGNRPPRGIQNVMEAVRILLAQKPARPDYAQCKKLMTDSSLLDRLKSFDKDQITEPMLENLRKYTSDKSFTPESVQPVSAICRWVTAMETYSVQTRRIGMEPMRATLIDAQKHLQHEALKYEQLKASVEKLKKKLAQNQLEGEGPKSGCEEVASKKKGAKKKKKKGSKKKAATKRAPVEMDELDELLSLVYGACNKLPRWKKEPPKELNARNALLAARGDLQRAMEHLRSRASTPAFAPSSIVRCHAFLMGTLTRVGVDSPVHTLPYDVVRLICLRLRRPFDEEGDMYHFELENQLVSSLEMWLLVRNAELPRVVLQQRRTDDHHQYSNYHGNAKNYGENFTLWDRMFGTASRRASRDT
eukprot:COSAG02_NODE_4067_length_5836_cov_18.100924_3_plen_541_part_00